jgi:nitrogen fixation/metabolism regulation signal transduction histidine kinase
METRVAVKVIAGPEMTFFADPDQIEQMLINLLRNAAEAVMESGRAASSNGSKPKELNDAVSLSWTISSHDLVIKIEDSGPGLMNPTNAFVPFYTTKPTGSGIGLVLSRQIAEAHGGSLELENLSDRHGCVVTIALPLKKPVMSDVTKGHS